MTIAQVCRKYDMTADTLRYYERVGLIPRVPRTAGGIRDYDDAACEWIGLMKCMRKAGVQIEALIEYVALYQKGDVTLEARENLLKEQRALLENRIAEMRESLDLLNTKIGYYEQGLMTQEQVRRRQQERARKNALESEESK